MIRAAVLGSPISHSLSPILHRAAYEHLGILGEYASIEITRERLREFIVSLDKSWSGLSLTMPLKEEILSIADEVDELALRINSANTLIRSPRGWKAITTDVNGFDQSLLAHGIFERNQVVILGSGATARAAAASCDGPGHSIRVIHRSPARMDQMRSAAPLSTMTFDIWGAELGEADLFINATPAGVADIYAENLMAEVKGIYFEALYYPWPSKMLTKWREFRGRGIDGLDLLVHQGIDQVELMTGRTIQRESLAPVLRAACLVAMKP